MRQIVKNFFGKAILSMLIIAMALSAAWFFEGETSVAYAAEDKYYFVEPSEDGVEITENMIAPKPTTEGKETYIFAGYFEDENCETPVTASTSAKVYKKFVPAEIMSVKAQVTKGTKQDSDKTDMRLVTTVDGLDYKEVGFDVYFNGAKNPVNAKTTTVYKRIIAADNGNAFGYSPEAFDVDSDYFTTVNLVNIANKNFDKTFFIKPYWKTLDGTKVYGLSRMARVSDSYNGIANVPVRIYTDSVVEGNAITVTYDSVDFTYHGFDLGNVDAGATTTDNGDGTITCTTSQALANVNDMLVNLRFKINDSASSNERFDMVGTGACNYLYKVFSTSYNGTPDTSWYDEFTDETEFVVSTPSDLYGLAEIVNDTTGDYKAEQFSGDTIKLGADMDLNTGWNAPNTAEEDLVVPANIWTPIGNDKKFQGTFDGKEHEIKGVYVTGKTTLLGLFGGVEGTDSMIKDLRVTNSYVEHTGATAFVGGVVGYLNKGTIHQVYCNAIVKSNGTQFGGIAGRAEGLVEKCWFDGEVYANRTDVTYVQAAGVVGTSWSQTGTGKTFTPLTIRNCLNTGKVIYNVTTTSGSGAGLGGIYGGDRGYTDLTVEYCINTGIIESNQKNGTGSIVGNISKSTTIDNEDTYSVVDITNCYGATDTITAHLEDAQDGRILGYTKNCDVTQSDNIIQDAENMNGHIAYDTIDGLSFVTSKVKDGVWVIREKSSNLKDGVPVPVAFADEWIDVAWYYDADKSDDKGETYSISTAEELYGFSEISQEYNFEGDTIQLTNDITANTGKASSWEKGTTTPNREWTPIGNSTTSFQGIFDGQKHLIKGIYVNVTTQNAGLFGCAEDATIQDLQLINSYIHSTVDRVGGIAGYYTGNMYRVYCDAIVVSTRDDTKESDCGGLIGYYNGLAGVTNKISECWFAGTAKGYNRTGGIVGRLQNGRKEISDTIVTGTVITTVDTRNAQIGGLVGSINNYVNAVLDITSSLGAGTMQDSFTGAQTHQTGGVVGYKGANGTVTINNVYTTFSQGLGAQNNDSGTSAVEADYTKIESIDDIKGSQVYTTDVMNLGYYMYDSTWVARITDIPVPRCFVGTVVDEDDIVEDTSAHTAWYDANPEATEFEIKTENDLLGVATIVNAADGDYAAEQFSGKTVKLAKDMDLNRGWQAPETVDEEVEIPAIRWTPIGNSTNKFQGNFNGQGYEIKGVYASGSDYVGLFGYGNGATLQNFQLTNSYIYGSSERVGSVIGCNSGNMSEIYSDAIVVSESDECGGLIGLLTGTVTNTISKCWFAGSVQGLRQTGGIIGNVAMGNKTIQHCLVTGDVNTTDSSQSGKNGQTGGMIGSVANKEGLVVSILSCLTTGDVTDGYSNAKCGGIIGYRNGTNTVSITDVYTTYENGGIGTQTENDYEIEDTVSVVNDINDIKGDMAYDEEKGLNLNYAVWIARTNDVPVPRCFVGIIVDAKDTIEDNSGRVYIDTDWYNDNQKASTYSIDTAHELAGLAQLVNDGITFDNKTINLVKDIDFNKGWKAPKTTADAVVAPVNTWMPIGNSSSVSFQGTFNGHGNTIKGIYVDEDVETTHTGLFGYTKTCIVKDLRLENSYFSTTNPYMGSIIGYGNGTLTNVYSDAIMHSTNIEVGGLVGRGVKESNSESSKLLTMTGCWFDGDIQVELSSTSAANAYVGGLVGYVFTSDAIIDTCLYTGDISLKYTSATANPNTRSGGLIGAENGTNAYATISNTISAGTITGIMEGTATAINNLCTTIGQVRSTSTACSNVYDMSVITKVIGGKSSTSTTKCGGSTTNVDTVKSNIHQTYDKEDIFGLGAQLLTNLDFVQDAEETIWAARKGQLPAPAGLVADSDELNVQFGKADQEIADGATGDSAEDPYIIENVEELYGFAILSRTNTFAGKYIKLSDDIEGGVLNLNPGESAEDWAEGTAASLPWYSIGTSSNRFAGHFNGNDKTISGIYMNSDNSYLGLFAATEEGSTIKNFRLINSYFNYTGEGTANVGSIVGDLRGEMTGVYSNAIIHSNGKQTGGLAALAIETSTDGAYAVNISNCWYDGQITSSATDVGGLVARVVKCKVNITNSMNTGIIHNTFSAGHAFVGGICGRVYGTSVKDEQSVVNITDCIAAGKITDVCGGRSVRSVVGYIDGATASEDVTSGSIVNFSGVFATKDSCGRAIPNAPKQKNKKNENDEDILDDNNNPIIEFYSGSYTQTIIGTHETDRLIGYCTEAVADGVAGTSFDYENTWTIRESEIPVLSCFKDLVMPVVDAQGSALESTLNAQIGLDTLGLSLINAVNMGEGNYVLKTTANDTTYNSYLATLKDTLGFGDPVAQNTAGAGVDGVHSVSYKKQNPDWVLTLTYVEKTGILTISINTDPSSLSDNLVFDEGVEDENYSASGDVVFTMLQLDAAEEEYSVEGKYYYGNSFVFQLPNGHFIINDGGEKEEFEELAAYLKEQARKVGLDKVYVDAWIVSHQHGDHFDILKAVADATEDPVKNAQYVVAKEDIYVDAFYISEPNAKTLALGNLDGDVDKQYYGMTRFTKVNGEQPDIYRMHTGQRYYFHGLMMDVIQAQEQIPYGTYAKKSAGLEEKDFNTASTVVLFTTSNNQKIFIGGDANYVNMQYIMDSYGANPMTLSNINVFVALHHGKNTSMTLKDYDEEWDIKLGGILEPQPDNSFTDYLITNSNNTEPQFDVILFPSSVIYDVNAEGKNVDALHDVKYAFPQAGEANVYLLGFAKEKQYYHYGNGTKEVTLSSTGINVQ